ncbi:MAG: hypothetical protein IPP40_08835 [bacterium]|nr:hypothetical protein [bacterium]
MNTADLQTQLGFCHFCIITNLEEITEAQALIEPKPSGNPVNYVIVCMCAKCLKSRIRGKTRNSRFTMSLGPRRIRRSS